MANNVGVFISHSWKYSDHYEKLAKWIFETDWSVAGRGLNFSNSSIPESNPIHTSGSEIELTREIRGRIYNSDVVVIPIGMYASHSRWIKLEVAAANEFHRPVLPVNPWGRERKSKVAEAVGREPVGWQAKSVVNGIWKLSNLVRI